MGGQGSKNEEGANYEIVRGRGNSMCKGLRQEQGTTEVAVEWGRERMRGDRTNKAQSLVWFDIPSV